MSIDTSVLLVRTNTELLSEGSHCTDNYFIDPRHARRRHRGSEGVRMCKGGSVATIFLASCVAQYAHGHCTAEMLVRAAGLCASLDAPRRHVDVHVRPWPVPEASIHSGGKLLEACTCHHAASVSAPDACGLTARLEADRGRTRPAQLTSMSCRGCWRPPDDLGRRERHLPQRRGREGRSGATAASTLSHPVVCVSYTGCCTGLDVRTATMRGTSCWN